MELLLKNARAYRDGVFRISDVLIADGFISACGNGVSPRCGARVVDCSDMYVFPGLADVHVHLREPGFSYKETIESGTLAGAAGGFTALCAMPNLRPAPDCVENLQIELDLIRAQARIPVFPFACMTSGGTGRGELLDYEALARFCVGFSDDGKGVQSRERMRSVMEAISKTGKLISAHCEDESLLHGGYIHDGAYARKHGHRGICPESEWAPIARDIELVRETGCKYHVCHVSTKESAALIREAKREGLPVSGETAPHYLLLSDDDLQEDGRFKMNPPLRSAEDRQAILDAVRDGTLDVLVTDHTPHAADEKNKGLKNSAFGVVGLETALSANWTALVQPGHVSPERLAELMSVIPRRRFSLPEAVIREGAKADICVFDPRGMHTVDPDRFHSKGRSTPFAGMELCGRVRMTVFGDQIVYDSGTEV